MATDKQKLDKLKKHLDDEIIRLNNELLEIEKVENIVFYDENRRQHIDIELAINKQLKAKSEEE